MGISRDSMHKRRATGGKQKAWRKKRKYELGRQPANTKLSSNKTVRRETYLSSILLGSRDKVRLQLRKQRRATTSRGSLRSVSRDAHLTPTLKSNLAVEVCWRAFLPALGSVAELTGMEYQHSVFLS
ncbi:40S ribosomal protein S8-like [Panicum virgatum]|uniref:40S ribosomal protein S8-like n=1 Tax=Panicum virgatum TaxID=38727 RepID=UPI0019D542F4|nr:40S ribosomal protein S8-like [Panicum virgatum]